MGIWISIHAPRTGSDLQRTRQASAVLMISIHAPRTGSDDSPACYFYGGHIFQSTLPARGATLR